MRKGKSREIEQKIIELQEQDDEFYWGDDPEFRDFPTSEDEHHQPLGQWAGPLQRKFGARRRGPSHNNK